MTEEAKVDETGLARAEGKRVLLISDPEPFVRDTLRIKFASKGYHVLLVSNGRDTVRMAARNVPDLIIMDIEYTDLDGVRICQMIKGNAKTSSIPIMVLSKSAEIPEKRFLYNAYAAEFIVKPFSPREVARTADKIIRAAAGSI